MQQKHGFFESVYDGLSSIRLTVVILLILAACSLIGTLLPQGTNVRELVDQYGPRFAWWVDTLGLNDLYHTGWFRFILVFLCMNLIVCSIQRLPKTIKLVRHREEQIHPEKLVKFALNREFVSPLPLQEIRAHLKRIFDEHFAVIVPLGDSSQFAGIAEKGSWSRFMVYVVHFSVLVILIGALLGSVLGFKGFMNLPEGEASNEVVLMRGDAVIRLPFEVRCDDFEVSFYETGAPKEFRSDLVVISQGKEMLKQAIFVNDPLTYDGITFYQASYGALIKEAEVEFLDRDKDTTARLVLPYRETMTIPGSSDRVQIVQYQDKFHQFGRAVGIVLLREGHEPEGSWILADMPDFHGNRIQNYSIRIKRIETGYYTGLQVKRDPGVWLVYIGFTVMIVGICMAFYFSHRKLWVWAGHLSDDNPYTSIVLAGRTSKNSLAFEREFNRLCEKIQTALQAQQTGKT